MSSIPDLATQIINSTVSNNSDTNSSALFFAGNKSSGKSTLLLSFLEKNETSRETLVLEYSFGRKTLQRQGIDKNVCHVWEYGGRLELLRNVLSSVPILAKYTYCIMVDLSKLKGIWHTLETCLQAYQEVFSKSNKYPELLIIGGKYDLFKNYNIDIRKTICTTLRSVALLYHSNLLFYSSKDSSLVRRAKETLHSISFGNGFPAKEKVTNISKPLFISKDLDSWENAGVSLSTLEQIKARHLSLIPLETEQLKSTGFIGTAAAFDNVSTSVATYAEPTLDSVLEAKYGELQNISFI